MARQCPICGSPMQHAGAIRPKVPFGRSRLLTVYLCRVCGYRSL